MDIVLDENDIKRLVVTALGMDVPLSDIALHHKPFCMKITAVERFFTPPKPAADLPRKDSDDPVGDIPEEPHAAPVLSLDELLQTSEDLAQQPPAQKTSAKPPRRLRAQEQLTPPPPSNKGHEV